MSTKLSTLVRSMLAAVVTAGLAVTPVLLGPPAAAVTGLTSGQAQSANNSAAEKVVTARCPAGTNAIGGSAVVGGTTRVRVNTGVPSASGYTVLAREPEGGVAENWFVVVTARCAPAFSLPGLEYRDAFSSFDSAATHSATAACSPGRRLIGTGGVVDTNGPGQDQVVLTAVRPSADLTRLTVSGAEDETGFGGSWRVRATAVCINPVLNQQLVSASSGFDSADGKSASAACPAGTKAHAGGFDVGSGRGEVNVASYFVDPDLPFDWSREGFVATGREDATGRAGDWRVAAFAVCAA